MDKYTCAVCEEEFEQGWTEEEAVAELSKNFPGFDKSECALVCDECYNKMGFADAPS